MIYLNPGLRSVTVGALSLGTLLLPARDSTDSPGDDVSRAARAVPASVEPAGARIVKGSLLVDRGGRTELWIPPAERLEFKVEVDLGILGDTTVGTVSMSSGVEPFVVGLPLPGQSLQGSNEQVAWAQISAHGGYLGYQLDHSLTTRFLPQAWPSLLNLEVQTGSENRKKELKVGRRDGAWVSSFRRDRHCGGCERREHFVEAIMPWNDYHHCKDCSRAEHRLWNDLEQREVPAQTLDVIGAVYLARTIIRQDLEELELSMVQKESVWDIKLTRGRLADIEVPAGVFRCREVRLSVSQPEGETDGSKRFKGLFGINGAIQLWFHETTGVPVQIEGNVPIGSLMELHARVRLSSAKGLPAAFGKL